jgi:hypothetical protein
MNAAEITDKLGLHSLRQRAWVRLMIHKCQIMLTVPSSTSNPPVLPPEMVFMKGWNGLHSPSARPVISKFGVVYLYQPRLCFKLLKNQSNLHTTPLISIIWYTIPRTILVSSAVYFHKRRKGGIVRLGFLSSLALCIASGSGDFTGLFPRFACLFGPLSGFPTSGLAILCFSMV